jgi:hypothetical protein
LGQQLSEGLSAELTALIAPGVYCFNEVQKAGEPVISEVADWHVKFLGLVEVVAPECGLSLILDNPGHRKPGEFRRPITGTGLDTIARL